ncbi:MAG: tetraacyldisaccharide 4'-kinase [Fluviicola sp.]|nr:MAG: tetraacyldisaccharide 4'-kinase [Fluviicola sp.]
MQILRYILLPFSFLYGGILYLRNLMFDLGIKKVEKVEATVVSIGNLSMGGTGKTPHVDWVVSKMKNETLTAILSRGYGRKSRGFLLVTKHSQAETVGDEALFYKRKHNDDVQVAVAEKRVEGAQKLLNLKPNLELIVLDDAYQHRYIHRDLNILLTDYSHPFYKDFVVPSGRLREFRSGKNRADVVIVTKCPSTLDSEERSNLKKKIDVSPNALICFSQVKYGEILPINSGEFTVPEQILLVTGIANPQPLYEHLKKLAKVELMSFPDHHDFTTKDIRKIHNLFDTFATQNKCIVTTAKDVPRLCSNLVKPLIENYPWFYQTINVEIDKEQELLKKIKEHVKKD